MENAAQIRKARSDAAKREVVAAALQEFLEEERDHLEDIVVRNGLEAARNMLASSDINLGFLMLFEFINARCKEPGGNTT